jgi:hypothetical protein
MARLKFVRRTGLAFLCAAQPAITITNRATRASWILIVALCFTDEFH